MDQKKAVESTEASPVSRQAPQTAEWIEPQLTFVEPKLTKQGELKDVTGFLGTFSP
jgi:hypothetical protein